MGSADVFTMACVVVGVLLIALGAVFTVVFAVGLLQIPPVMVWVERRAPAMMQRRKGPNRVGLGKFRLYDVGLYDIRLGRFRLYDS